MNTVFTPAEVAGIMKCSTALVRRMVERGELIGSRESGFLRISADSVSDLMAGAAPGTTARARDVERSEQATLVGALKDTVVRTRAQVPIVGVAVPEEQRRLGEAYHVPHLTYVVRSAPFVKIGTTSDVRTRFRALVAANPHDIEVVAVLVGGHKTERTLHARFAAHRHRDEWFREEGALAEWIAGGCQP